MHNTHKKKRTTNALRLKSIVHWSKSDSAICWSRNEPGPLLQSRPFDQQNAIYPRLSRAHTSVWAKDILESLTPTGSASWTFYAHTLYVAWWRWTKYNFDNRTYRTTIRNEKNKQNKWVKVIRYPPEFLDGADKEGLVSWLAFNVSGIYWKTRKKCDS